MTILITGGTGLLGRAVIQSLLDHGVHPRVVTRRPHRALEFFDSRVTAFEWHPRTEALPAPALDGVERILHLMGEPLLGPASRARRARVVASRREGTRAIMEALGRRRVHVIVASSTAVYGCGQGPAVTESSTLRRPKDKFALALLSCEEIADELRQNGCTVTLVRLGHVIAAGGFAEDLWRLHRKGLTWRETHPDAGVPAIDHADAASLLTWLARFKPLPGPIHAVAPEPLRTVELRKLLMDASPRRIFATLPRWMLRARLGAIADALHNRQHIVPQRALDAGFVFSRPDPLESVRSVLAQLAALRPASPAQTPLGPVPQRT
jgi:NAD dependent epimerase/dehydratase family enzyme